MIRPSGNPLDLDGFKGMLGSPDIIVEKDEVISVDDVKLFAGGEAAIVVYTTLSKFTYQGNPNDDVAKFSATLEKADGAWKIVHLHRGTGQKPSSSNSSMPPPTNGIRPGGGISSGSTPRGMRPWLTRSSRVAKR